MPLVGGERGVLDLLEVDRLQALPVDPGEEVEVVRVDGAIAQLLHPVALELEEPVEPEVGVDEAPVPAELHEGPERVESRQTGEPVESAEPVPAARGRVGGGEGSVLLLQQRGDVEADIVVVIDHALR